MTNIKPDDVRKAEAPINFMFRQLIFLIILITVFLWSREKDIVAVVLGVVSLVLIFYVKKHVKIEPQKEKEKMPLYAKFLFFAVAAYTLYFTMIRGEPKALFYGVVAAFLLLIAFKRTQMSR